jgi:hypothetical protein
MTVGELIYKLAKYPADARVYTEQYNSNATNEILYCAQDNILYIGDDTTELCEDYCAGGGQATKAPDYIYVVHLEALDDGVPYHHIEAYKKEEDAYAAWDKLAEEELGLHADFTEGDADWDYTNDPKAHYFYLQNNLSSDYATIWVTRDEIK